MLENRGAVEPKIVTLVLASASPRRRELLEAQGLRLHVHPTHVDETPRANETPAAYLERIVADKLVAARKDLHEGTRAEAILVADTTVVVDGAIVGKPESRAESAQMIERLAGREHDVMTRFAIALAHAEKSHAETVTTRVTFRALSKAEILAYAATGEGDDKAGAYAVQGRGAALVKKIDGSYSNVVGLPICEVMVALAKLGVHV